MSDDRVQDALARLAADQEGSLPGLLGFLWTHASRGEISGRLEPTRRAATAVCNPCPKRATGFATAELKANFIGTARDGGVTCNARLVHGGSTTQLWDAEVKEERFGKTIALFRCTQILLYPDRVLSG